MENAGKTALSQRLLGSMEDAAASAPLLSAGSARKYEGGGAGLPSGMNLSLNSERESDYLALGDGNAAMAASRTAAAASRPAASVSAGGGRGGGPGPAAPNTGLGIVESPIDFGFPVHAEFDRGVCETLVGQEGDVDMSKLQQPLSFGAKLCSAATIVVCFGTVLAVPYVLFKITLVRKGEIAITEHMDGTTRVLGTGWHLLGTVGAKVTRFNLQDDVIKAGILNIIRVRPGHVGLATQNGRPVLLLPGRHLVNDALFVYQTQRSLNEQHIHHSTLHLITVRTGEVGLCMVDSTAHFLEHGRHHINNPRFSFLGFRPATSEHISCGSKHRVVIPAGNLGMAWQAGSPLLLEPGQVYNIDSPTFKYERSVPITTPVILHGSLKLITVRQGFVGVSFEDGALNVLPPGRHLLKKPTHSFHGFLSMGQQTLQISELTSMSCDNVGLVFDAAVTVQICDPVKAITMLASGPSLGSSEFFDPSGLFANIVEKAKLALSIIIGNSGLHHVARAASKTARASGAAATASATADIGGDPSADAAADGGSFKQHVHDVFMTSFSSSMAEDCGILVRDMSIEDVRISNAELAKAMAQGAVARTELVRAQLELDIRRTQALAEQASEIMRAEGHARAISILADAEAARVTKLDAAMASVAPVTQQRELVLAAGEVLAKAQATVLLGNSVADLGALLGGSGRGGFGSNLLPSTRS